MKNKILNITLLMGLSFSVTTANEIYLKKGWDLKGAAGDISVKETFNKPNTISSVWAWDAQTKSWKAYSPSVILDLAIKNNPDVSVLTSLEKNDGFWVNSKAASVINASFSNSDDNVSDENNNSQDQNNTQDINSSNLAFVDPLVDIKLSDIASKSFKIYNYENEDYDTLTFNANGEASFTESDCLNKTFTLSIKLEEGTLNIYEEGELVEWFKLLAADDTGIVLGGQELEDHDYVNQNSRIEYLLNSSVTESAVDMSQELPYTIYNSYDSYHVQSYENNMTIGWGYYDTYNKEYLFSYNDQNFTINSDKAIEESNSYTSTDYSSSYSSTHQVVASIGRYDIINRTHNHTYSQKIDTITSTDTWSDILSDFGSNRGITFYEANSSFESSYSGGTYSISGNDLILSHQENHDDETWCWEEKYVLDASNQKVTIISDHSGNREVVSSSPILDPNYNSTSYYNTAARVLGKKTAVNGFDLISDNLRKQAKKSIF